MHTHNKTHTVTKTHRHIQTDREANKQTNRRITVSWFSGLSQRLNV